MKVRTEYAQQAGNKIRIVGVGYEFYDLKYYNINLMRLYLKYTPLLIYFQLLVKLIYFIMSVTMIYLLSIIV